MRNHIRAAFHLLARSAYAKAAFLVTLYPLAAVVLEGAYAVVVPTSRVVLDGTSLVSLNLQLALFMAVLSAAGLVAADQHTIAARNACLSQNGRWRYAASRLVVVMGFVVALTVWALVWGLLALALGDVFDPSKVYVSQVPWGAASTRTEIGGTVARCLALPIVALVFAWLGRIRGYAGVWLLAILFYNGADAGALALVSQLIQAVLGLFTSDVAFVSTNLMKLSISYMSSYNDTAWLAVLAAAYIAASVLVARRLWARRAV